MISRKRNSPSRKVARFALRNNRWRSATLSGRMLPSAPLKEAGMAGGKRLLATAFLSLTLIPLCSTASAQESRGSIAGLVVDTSGGAPPGVTITIVHHRNHAAGEPNNPSTRPL